MNERKNCSSRSIRSFLLCAMLIKKDSHEDWCEISFSPFIVPRRRRWLTSSVRERNNLSSCWTSLSRQIMSVKTLFSFCLSVVCSLQPISLWEKQLVLSSNENASRCSVERTSGWRVLFSARHSRWAMNKSFVLSFLIEGRCLVTSCSFRSSLSKWVSSRREKRKATFAASRSTRWLSRKCVLESDFLSSWI